MSDQSDGGQATADSTGTTASAPDQTIDSTVASSQTTSGPDAGETFFDPTSIAGKPELEAAYKQMQGAFTKRNQAFKAAEAKVKQYDQFLADPMGTLKQVAAQYGLHVVQPTQDTPKDFNPQSWEDVKKHFFEEWEQKHLKPVVNEVKNLKKQNIETFLDANHSDWRNYETEMMGLLRNHPTLVNDPSTLYRMAVPAEEIEKRATKAAMQRLKDTTATAQASGSKVVKQVSDPPIKPGPNAFQQAAEWARKQLAEKGLRRPA